MSSHNIFYPDTAPPPEIVAKKSQTRFGAILLQLVAMFGIGLLVYSDAADWFSRLGQASEITGYTQRAEQTPAQDRQRILDAAYAYNDELEPGPLTDPYISPQEHAALGTDIYQAYEQMLRLSGTDAIGTVNYPDLDIALPVYHGTEDDTIAKGAGHLYGTSLPVGGPSTRSVLTAHSGLVHAELFTGLLEAEVGDIFWISVLGEDHYYAVRKTETVLPNQTESLRIIDGEDWVTLFTCSPIGINSHRFLVHAERIADPEPQEHALTVPGPGFPWRAVWFVFGSATAAWLLFAPVKPKRATTQTGTQNTAQTE